MSNPIPPNAIAAYVVLKPEAVEIKVRLDHDLSPTEEYIYYTYLIQALEKRQADAKQRREKQARAQGRRSSDQEPFTKTHKDQTPWP